MKKNIFLVLSLCLIFADLFSYTNKTYIRPVDMNILVPTRFKLNDFCVSDRDNNLLARVDVNAYQFYSRNSKRIGSYFGVNEKQKFLLGGNNSLDKIDVWNRYLIHSLSNDNNATVSLLPKTQLAGVNLSLIFDLSNISKKLFLKFNLPYQRVQNNVRMGFSSTDDKAKSLKDYLQGNYSVATGIAQQEVLRYAKITDQLEKKIVPFLDFILGYNFRNDDDIVNTLKLALVIPTEKKHTAEYMFEPFQGNGNHFALNVGFEGRKNTYSDSKSRIDILWDLNYKYLFENTQKRTLGIKGANWGQYYLLGKNGVTGPLIPAANVLTQDVNVSPGSRLDLNLEALFGYHASRVSVGGNLILRREEEVSLKTAFPEQTYAVANSTFSTTDEFNINEVDFVDAGYSTFGLNENNIDFRVAQNPGGIVFRFYTQYAYIYKKKNSDKEFAFSIGSSVNLSDKNSTIGGYGLWLNTSCSF